MEPNVIRNILLGVGGLVIGSILLASSCTQVNTGQIGIKTTFGAVTGDPLPPGIYFVAPFVTDVHSLNTRIITTVVNSEAASKDLQVVDTAITLNYNLSTHDPKEFFIRLGNNQDLINASIVSPAINETFKAVVAQFTAEQLISQRDLVSKSIEDLLTTKLKQYDLFIDSISITSFKFSDAFNEAIEAKVTAQQKVLTAENDLQRIKVEAQQKIAEAQANATAMQSQAQTVTPEILQMEAIKKWDGHLPDVWSGSPLPFLVKGGK